MKHLIFAVCLLLSFQAFAQELSYGFKVGLNFSTIKGPSEEDLESFDYNSGFHVGGGVIYKITDRFGVKGEILFSQKGVKYGYDGPSAQLFTEDDGDKVLGTGTRRMQLNVSNSYIELPFTAYAKITERIEVFGGANINFLVGTSAVGEYVFSGAIPDNPAVDIIVELDHSYFKDKVASPDDITADTEVIKIPNGIDELTIPKRVGAYYLDFPEKDGSFYNIIDLGLHAGVAYYLNGGLYLGVTVNYGLLDATNDFYDISKVSTDGLEYISRSDKDTNLSFQTSVGFSF